MRAHVRLVAAIWLTCQVAAFAASPFVLCHDSGVMAADGHECDSQQHHHHYQQPGQPASTPAAHEHHHQSSGASDQASVNCRCTISDAALAALTLETGILPGAFAISATDVPTRVVLLDYAAPTRSHIPDTPPPRA